MLVPIIEEGLQDSKILIEIITLYLNPIINSNIDTLILGCTHYPIIKKKLKNFLPNNINYVTSGVPVAKTLEGYLAKNNLYNSIDNSSIKFYVSDNLDKFKRLGSQFSNNPITDIELIQL